MPLPDIDKKIESLKTIHPAYQIASERFDWAIRPLVEEIICLEEENAKLRRENHQLKGMKQAESDEPDQHSHAANKEVITQLVVFAVDKKKISSDLVKEALGGKKVKDIKKSDMQAVANRLKSLIEQSSTFKKKKNKK